MNVNFIAFKVIQRLMTMKYFKACFIPVVVKNYTDDPRIIKKTYSVVRRALLRLGYEEGITNPQQRKR